MALASRGKQMQKEIPNFNRKLFLYHLSRASYEKKWGRDYSKPGKGARVMAFILHIVPKVGPFRGLSYKDPTPQTEDLYMQSVNQTVSVLRTALKQVHQPGTNFPAIDLDTGAPTRAGEYVLSDETYRELLRRMQKDKFAHTDSELRTAVIRYFTNFQPKLQNAKDTKRWADDECALNALKVMELPPSPTAGKSVAIDSAPKAQ